VARRGDPWGLSAELDEVVRQAAGYAEQFMADLGTDPNLTGIDVWVGSGASRWRRPKSISMEALLLRYEDKKVPAVLTHVEPLLHRDHRRQPWRLLQTPDAARDNMSAALKRRREIVP
jgi:hypothetical protein